MSNCSWVRGSPMRVRVGCRFRYECAYPTPMLFSIRPRTEYHHRVIEERWSTEPDIPLREYVDGFGNRIWRLTALAGLSSVVYDAIAEVPPTSDPQLLDLPKTPIDDLPDDVIVYLLPS